MAQTWEATSEIVVGLLLDKKISLTLVRPELFFPPYDDVIKHMKQGKSPEELIEICGFMPIQTAHEAVMNLNGLGESIKWVQLLETTKSRFEASKRFSKMSKVLERGEDIDWSEVSDVARRALQGISGDFIPLSEIESRELPFIPSGWGIIDKHLGGFPEVGMILVGGDPGIGKTTFAGRAITCFAQYHKNKSVAVFSLEMLNCELAMRMREIEKSDKSIEDRILINDVAGVTAEEIVSKAATIENLGLVVVDFGDLVVEENTEAAYSKMYRTFAFGSKQLHVPFIVLVQLIKAKNGIPRPVHLRYTKMAEAFAWMILMLYDPSKDWDSEDDKQVLPVKSGGAYILAWKIRGGFRMHKDEAPGAILTSFSGEKGWGVNGSRWHSLKKYV